MASHNSQQSQALFWADFRWLLLCLVFGWIAGWYFAEWYWGVIIGLLLYSVWRFVGMQRFHHWVNDAVNTPPPEFSGGLTYVANQLYQSHKREQMTQQKMLGLVKKIRGSLLALQDAVILLDKEDRLEWWNQSAEKLLALQSEDQGNQIFSVIAVPEFHQYYEHATSPNDGIRLPSWRNPERYLQCEVTHFGDEAAHHL